MLTRSEQIAELQTDIVRYTGLLSQARAEQQRIQDELRIAQVQLFKLEIEEERMPSFIQIPPTSL